MNQKGGVGKTTLIKGAANYLSGQSAKIACIDADIQKSLKMIYDEDVSLFENEKRFEVIDRSLDTVVETVEILQDQTDIEYYLIDLPGNLNDNRLIELFKVFDNYLVPFFYDRETYQSTLVFAKVIKHINPDCNLVFVPNRVKSNVKYKIREGVKEELSKYGAVAHAVSDLVGYQRLRFFENNARVNEDMEKILHYFNV